MRVVGKSVNERRRDSRPKLPPIRVRFGGQPYSTTDWTLGGFMVAPYTDSHKAGNIFEVDIYIDVGAETITCAVEAMVARIDTEARILAAKFIDLEPAAMELLESWMTGRLRRQMAREAKKKSNSQA